MSVSRALLFCLAVTLNASAQTTLPDEKLHALIVQGIDLTWKQYYSQADSIFGKVISLFPNHPAGYAYRAGVMQTIAVDHELSVDQVRLDSLLVLAKEKSKLLIDAGGADAKWGYFYLATAEGCDSYSRVYRGDWMGGALRGVAAFSAFKDAISQDSGLVDAYAGIGGFYYWRSRKTEHFNWLPFVGDDRPKALPMLMKTAEHGVYNRFTALSMLVAISSDAGEYDKAIAFAREGLRTYPSNQVFLWGLTTALEKKGDVRGAVDAFEVLLKSLQDEHGANAYNELVCHLNLGRLRLSIGDTAAAKSELGKVESRHAVDFPAHLRERVEKKLDQAKELLQKMGAVAAGAN